MVFTKWSGSYDGKDFKLTVSFNTSEISNLASVSHSVFTISGTYGSLPVNGTVFQVKNPADIGFKGTIGPHHVSGTVTPSPQGKNTATATFTVTS